MKRILVTAVIALNFIVSMAQTNWQANPIGAIFAREGGTTPEGTYRASIGGYEVFTIVSADKIFQPASLYYGMGDCDKAKVDALAPDGKVPTSMNCFLVATPDGYVMFDTGLPPSKDGKTLERLAALDVSTGSIRTIFLTHAHFDHIGALLDDNGAATFPNARIFISKPEFAWMVATMSDTAKAISKAYGDRLTTFEFGEILPHEVLPIAATGHTPGHTAYRLGNILFVGDIMHGSAVQLIDPEICASFDADKRQAIATRSDILRFAASNSLTVIGAHIPLNGVLF